MLTSQISSSFPNISFRVFSFIFYLLIPLRSQTYTYPYCTRKSCSLTLPLYLLLHIVDDVDILSLILFFRKQSVIAVPLHCKIESCKIISFLFSYKNFKKLKTIIWYLDYGSPALQTCVISWLINSFPPYLWYLVNLTKSFQHQVQIDCHILYSINWLKLCCIFNKVDIK